MMEFHISRQARDRYQVSDVLFNFVGNVIFGDLAAVPRAGVPDERGAGTLTNGAGAIRARCLRWG